jgi:hypothetical protein
MQPLQKRTEALPQSLLTHKENVTLSGYLRLEGWRSHSHPGLLRQGESETVPEDDAGLVYLSHFNGPLQHERISAVQDSSNSGSRKRDLSLDTPANKHHSSAWIVCARTVSPSLTPLHKNTFYVKCRKGMMPHSHFFHLSASSAVSV